MPTDPPRTAPATATVATAAGGHLTTVTYTWTHPADGPQDGLLVLGADEGGTAAAFWGDSWHQHPGPRTLSGPVTGGVWSVGYDYVPDEWRWQVVVDTSRVDVLRFRMDNVPLAGGEPPYAAMDAVFQRAAAVA